MTKKRSPLALDKVPVPSEALWETQLRMGREDQGER